ncbi:MAG: DUF1992 domain-containing protein [Akkermansiaceae bacterium]|nr:DUF1992 domain-containing protein [Armatimonadota bacterium]
MSGQNNGGTVHPNFDWTALIADRKIKEAMDAGEFDNLVGKGEPIRIEDDPFTPPELRVAHKLLKNANALPQWLQLEKDIERERDAVLPYIERGVRAVTQGKNQASKERIAARFRAEVRDRMDLVNTLILKYNEVTPGSLQRIFAPFAIKRELAALDERIAELTESVVAVSGR